MEKNKKKKLMYLLFLVIILIVFSIISEKFVINPPFILTRLDEYEKVNIKSVKLNELQNVTNSIESKLYFSYPRFIDRLSSTNVKEVTLTVDINKQVLYEKLLTNNKIEYIEIPPSLAGYRIVYAKTYSTYIVYVYFMKDNMVKIMRLDDYISNDYRLKEIASIVAFGDIYKTFTKSINKNRTSDRIVYVEKNKANKIVFNSKKKITDEIIFYTNKLKNNGIIIEGGK